ncbi:MAG TPA: hypothetical protein PKK26_06345 [Candidatus Wallbacteria bacterium]|nr:hypothetical protein [Candidatus Wallbacteria bacterium]
MKFKVSLSILVVFMVVLFAGFVHAQSASTETTTATTTVTAEQVKAANDKFIAARTEYQTAVKSGAEKSVIESAYVRYIAARDEYQKLNQAAGNCIIGSGQGAKNNGGKGQGGNGSSGRGRGQGNKGGCR